MPRHFASCQRLAIAILLQVLVDECTQATEPEALMPLVMGAKQVLISDDSI